MNTWRKIASVQSMLLCLWIVGFAIYQMAPLSDPDTPWHYATGLYILQHHIVPTTDPFSYTMHGQPWVTQEWLFETILAWLGLHFGFWGLWLLISVVHAITVLVLYRTLLRMTHGSAIISAMCACVGTLVPLIFWTMRPQMISYMMFAVFLWVLQCVRDGQFKALWMVPPFMLFWANSHGSSTIGIALLVLEVFVSFLPSMGRFEKHRLPHGARWRLLLAAAAGAVVGLCNPNFYKAYTYALLSTNQLMVDHINEWHSPNFHGDVFKYGILPFILITFLIAMIRRKSIPIRDTLYFGGSFAFMLVYQRFAPYMAIMGAILLGNLLSGAFRRLLSPRLFMMVINGCIMVATLVYFGTQLPGVKGSVNDHMSTGAYPVNAVNYLQSHHLTGNLLNAYHWGGYLIYRGIPTFVDGRTDIYLQNSTFSDYLAMENIWWNGPDIIDIRKINVVLFPSGYTVITYLRHQPDWKVVYQDSNAEILVRTTPLT